MIKSAAISSIGIILTTIICYIYFFVNGDLTCITIALPLGILSWIAYYFFSLLEEGKVLKENYDFKLGQGFEKDEFIQKVYYSPIKESPLVGTRFLVFTNIRIVFSDINDPDIVDCDYCTWNNIKLARLEKGIHGYYLTIYWKGPRQRKIKQFYFSFWIGGSFWTSAMYDSSRFYELEKIRDHIMDRVNYNKYKFTEVENGKFKREYISGKLRWEIFKRDDFTCQFCGKTINQTLLHVDHILPVSKGGKSVVSNLQTLCEECNLRKSNK